MLAGWLKFLEKGGCIFIRITVIFRVTSVRVIKIIKIVEFRN